MKSYIFFSQPKNTRRARAATPRRLYFLSLLLPLLFALSATPTVSATPIQGSEVSTSIAHLWQDFWSYLANLPWSGGPEAEARSSAPAEACPDAICAITAAEVDEWDSDILGLHDSGDDGSSGTATVPSEHPSELDQKNDG